MNLVKQCRQRICISAYYHARVDGSIVLLYWPTPMRWTRLRRNAWGAWLDAAQ
jgi:hypothetical protein